MTYNEILATLAAAGIDNAAYEAGLLLWRFCGVDAAKLPLARDRDYRSEELETALLRRVGHTPLQYLIGEWGFCDEVYEVSPDCLIPRPDTELLVETAAELLPRGARFADLGTGSGCIAISLLARRTDLTAIAVDISPAALSLAEKNARRNGVSDRVVFISGDILSRRIWQQLNKLDALISNPPYIPSKDISTLAPELSCEPRLALDGGEDGLSFYRHIIDSAHLVLCSDGCILVETGMNQTSDVARLGDEAGYKAEILYDIEHRDRAVRLYGRNTAIKENKNA